MEEISTRDEPEATGDFILTVSSVVAIAFATLLVVLLPFREMTSEIGREK